MTDHKVQDIFTRVTQKIMADLEKGLRPWQQPWSHKTGTASVVRPRRYNGEPYNGVNVLLLWNAAREKGFHNPTFMTFKQAETYGACIRKGEKSSPVVFVNKIIKTTTDVITGESQDILVPFMKGYSVFNVEQIIGLPESFYVTPEKPQGPFAHLKMLGAVECFINHTNATIRHGGNRAFYSPADDFIQMPPYESFRDREGYYATKLHETHWTRHEKRLNRSFGRGRWGDEGYAKEELVAEIGAAFLCADLGITPEAREDHAAYIKSWLSALDNDKKLIFSAAAHASRAVELLKKLQPAPIITIKPSRVQSGTVPSQPELVF